MSKSKSIEFSIDNVPLPECTGDVLYHKWKTLRDVLDQNGTIASHRMFDVIQSLLLVHPDFQRDLNDKSVIRIVPKKPLETLPSTAYHSHNNDQVRILVNFPYVDIARVLAKDGEPETQLAFILAFAEQLTAPARLDLFSLIKQEASKHAYPQLKALGQFILAEDKADDDD